MRIRLKIALFMIILLIGVGATPSFASEIYNLNSQQIKYIYTVEDFDNIVNDNAGVFILMNDLDLSTSKSIGQIQFTGILYGNGHVLSNWTSSSGLFSVINNAEIYDLGIQSVSATSYVFASQILNSKLENVYVDNMTTTTGCLTGILLSSTLSNVYVTAPSGIALLNSGNTINSVYYDSDKFIGSTIIGSGLSTAEMMNQAKFSGWDFNQVWTIAEGVSNPRFTHYNNLKLVGTRANYNKAENKVSISLFFNQTPEIGAGSIHVLKKEDDSEVLALASADGVIDGKIVTLSSEISLDENTEYYIEVDAGAFDNGNGGMASILDRVATPFKIQYFESGDGSSEHPYEINNFDELNKIHEGLNYDYKLMSDIDLEGKNMTPIGDNLAPFIGVLDGNGHVIDNYSYEETDGSYAGLFGYNKGSIKNLGLENVDIIIQGSASSSVSLSGSYVGGLVGFNSGTVENCYTTGEVLGKSNVGGLIGNNQGEIKLCYSEANVTSSDYLSTGYNNEGFYTGGLSGRNALEGTIFMSYATGDVTGCEQVGGLVGNAFKGGLISNSYATGNVIGYYDVGGLMGRNYQNSTVENVYSTGVVSLYAGGTSSGGLIGAQASGGTLTNGYYNLETSGKSDDLGKGSPKTTLEMLLGTTYVGFDIDATWAIVEGRSNPYLRLNKPDTIPGIINQAPGLTTTDIYTKEDTMVTGNLLGTDEDGDTINYTLVQVTSSGSVNVTTSGTYTYMPNENFYGEDQFSVAVTDGFVTTTAVINVHVEVVNHSSSNKHSAPAVLRSSVLPTTDTTQTVDGKKVTQVKIGISESLQYLNDATQGAEKQKQVHIQTAQPSDIVQFTLTGELIDRFNKNQVNYSFETPQIAYQFAYNAIDIKHIATDLGVLQNQYSDIKFDVKVERMSIESLPKVLKGKVLMSPIQFEVTASYTSESGEIETIIVQGFNQYVERSFTLPEEVEPTKVTTGVVADGDGHYSHIPTTVVQENGEWKVQLHSMTNSEYTIIYNDVKVASVSGHWSENVVNRMASNLVLVDYESFKPNEAVTRGEFIDYVIRGLGLYREDIDMETELKDLDNSTYAQSIKIAEYRGIISGYEEGTFKPNNQISREEAMMIFSNALTLIQSEDKLIGNHDISEYNDKTEVSNWAVDAVKEVVRAGVFNGRSNQKLAPKQTLTCAEAVVAVNNLLVKTNLISEKTN